MKHRFFLALFAAVSLLTHSSTTIAQKLYPLDSIAVVIFGDDTTILIAESEIGRPSIDGQSRSLDAIIFEYLVYLDARRMKIMPDQEAIDKHLKDIQRRENMSDDVLKKIFNDAGYTFEEGRMQFELMTTIDNMFSFKIRSRLIVPDAEVKLYVEKYPEIQYELEVAYTTYKNEEEKATLEKQLNALAAGKKVPDLTLTWNPPFWVKEEELSENLQFITKVKPGSIGAPQEIPDGFQIWRLKTKHQRTVEERYRDVSNILKRPKYEELMRDYRKELFDNSSIMYINPDLAPKQDTTPKK